MLPQAFGDRIESREALGVTACAGLPGLADEVGKDIVLGVGRSVVRRPLGQGHDPVAEEEDAVRTVDLPGRQVLSLLGEPEGDAGHSVENDTDDPRDLQSAQPRRDPKLSGWCRTLAQCAPSLSCSVRERQALRRAAENARALAHDERGQPLEQLAAASVAARAVKRTSPTWLAVRLAPGISRRILHASAPSAGGVRHSPITLRSIVVPGRPG